MHKIIDDKTQFSNSSTHIGTSKYKLIEELPEYLESKLNGK